MNIQFLLCFIQINLAKIVMTIISSNSAVQVNSGTAQFLRFRYKKKRKKEKEQYWFRGCYI